MGKPRGPSFPGDPSLLRALWLLQLWLETVRRIDCDGGLRLVMLPRSSQVRKCARRDFMTHTLDVGTELNC
ncbi:hypothetical protein OE88DRAFT_1652782 [Heliocybe sulcata]|uniref:Secreted protein n=1 Tax=Heliocybe sulcata TaxID=5364 RepID=A0A5C3NGV2_9AGAM|nr:hypothetical protein OE88DRAFT_1652782 [Heliocybe sulcata]